MSLTNTHYCDILLNMSQRAAHFNLISPTQKMPSAFFATDLGNRHTQTKRAPSRGVDRRMRNGERHNKIPTYEKSFMPMATDITYLLGHNFGTCNFATQNCCAHAELAILDQSL